MLFTSALLSATLIDPLVRVPDYSSGFLKLVFSQLPLSQVAASVFLSSLAAGVK